MAPSLEDLLLRLERARADRLISRQVARVEAYLAKVEADQPPDEPPVLFFNASTRIHTLSLNAAFSLLASWRLRLSGVHVRHVVCDRGMQQCILGTQTTDPETPPPCRHCTRFSGRLFPASLTIPLTYHSTEDSANQGPPRGASLEQLIDWRYQDLSLGSLCLPGLRWALRRHNLIEDPATLGLMRKYLRSAASLVDRFERIIDSVKPRALVVFNGLTYPEAVARAVAQLRGVATVTHEVGLQPYSAYFSHEHATFREVAETSEGVLPPGWEEQVDTYLEQRRRGRFSMAGVQFWPEMDPVPEWLERRIKEHQQVVPVFTNVVFDTSQAHANTLFEDMFDWLRGLQGVIAEHPDTLFVLRAHPDEDRPGKASRESVEAWFRSSALGGRGNVAFVPPSEYVSSYELVEQAKCVLVYSSSIGLEAAIMGAPVLCAGRARYTGVGAAHLPGSRSAYFEQLEEFLGAERIELPETQRRQAKSFLYRELHHASLNLSAFLRPYPSLPGMVLLTDFEPQELEDHSGLNAIRRGVLQGVPFLQDAPLRAREAQVERWGLE